MLREKTDDNRRGKGATQIAYRLYSFEYSKEPLPGAPFESVKRREGETGCKRSRVNGRSKGNEHGELLPERWAHAERQGNESQPIALRVTDESNLPSACVSGLQILGL